MTKFELDLDDLITAAAEELREAMRSDNPDPHVKNARRWMSILWRNMEQLVYKQFPCGTCGELRTSEFCPKCKMTEGLDFDELHPEDEVRE